MECGNLLPLSFTFSRKSKELAGAKLKRASTGFIGSSADPHQPMMASGLGQSFGSVVEALDRPLLVDW